MTRRPSRAWMRSATRTSGRLGAPTSSAPESAAVAAPLALTTSAGGRWAYAPQLPSGFNPVHMVVGRGKILVVAGSGNDLEKFAEGTFKSYVCNAVLGSCRKVDTPVDLFCAGHVLLPDGRALVGGGTLALKPNKGAKYLYAFDFVSERYQRLTPMEVGRWYPTHGHHRQRGDLDHRRIGRVGRAHRHHRGVQSSDEQTPHAHASKRSSLSIRASRGAGGPTTSTVAWRTGVTAHWFRRASGIPLRGPSSQCQACVRLGNVPQQPPASSVIFATRTCWSWVAARRPSTPPTGSSCRRRVRSSSPDRPSRRRSST